MEERNTKYKLEVYNDDTGELIYQREFATQEMLEEHLREVESEVELYYKATTDVAEEEF